MKVIMNLIALAMSVKCVTRLQILLLIVILVTNPAFRVMLSFFVRGQAEV